MGRPIVARIGIAGALLVATLVARPAAATPQLGAAATTGVALTDLRADGPRVAYHLGARFDALFLRDAPRQMALGPYVDVATAAFDTLEAGGGLSWLVPVDATAFIFSAGSFARTSALGWEPGVAGGLFWGSRSFNYHSKYAIGVGLFAQGRYGLGDGEQGDVIGGLHLDLEYLALPFVFLFEAIRR